MWKVQNINVEVEITPDLEQLVTAVAKFLLECYLILEFSRDL